MRRRIDPRAFGRAGELVGPRQRAGRSWYVCEGYELSAGIIRMKPDIGAARTKSYALKPYKPLEDVPDLFLRFARLHKSTNFPEAALSWSHKYGVPGGDSQGHSSSMESMKLSLFWTEAKRAWIILTMYEAALNRDAQTIRDLIHNDLYRDDALEWSVHDFREGWSEAEYLAVALLTPVYDVDSTVQLLCRRSLEVPTPYYDPDPSNVTSSWEFDSLVGAMYLQMYWLLESGGDVTRCEHCGRIISLGRPHPGGRKRRSDKRFCDEACRQAHHRSKKRLQTALPDRDLTVTQANVREH
jgi:hypothetical protein